MLVLTNLCALCDSQSEYFTGSHLSYSYQASPGYHGITTGINIQPATSHSTLRPNKQLTSASLCFSTTSSTSRAHAWGLAGLDTTERERAHSPVWVCALLVEPDLARPGQSHTVTLLENIDNKPFYVLLLQLLSIIARTVCPVRDKLGITKPPGYLTSPN